MEWETIFAYDGVNIQNTQRVHTAQCQKNKQSSHKMGRKLEQTFFQRHTDG